MADVGRGLPLLSGPPPQVADSDGACRKCSKEFNIIFARSRRCNHCGYTYCHSCTDFLALMPRGGHDSGYDSQNVCAYCIEYLGITAAGRGQLRSMPLGKLRKYVNAYNIKVGRVVEKDDLIDRIMMARGPNGCLSPECEAFYRRYSVPARPDGTRPRGLFSSRTQNDLPPATTQTPRRQATTEFARPDLAPDDPPPVPPRYQPPPGPPPGYRQPPTTPPRSQYYHQPPPVPPRPQAQPPPPNTNTRPWPGNNQPSTPPRPRAASTSPESRVPPSPPPPSPPDLNELLSMTDDSIAALSIGNLKSILFQNRVNARHVIEKAELVKKVRDLVDNERRERERAEIQRQMEEQEEQERIQQMIAEEERRRREQEGAQETANGETASPSDDASVDADGDSKMEGAAKPIPKPTPSTAPSKAHISAFERNGLCVICQDEEANIAIVDCGHMAMCRGCSDLVMASSRECPLCRTRIVTEARLLRIFKT